MRTGIIDTDSAASADEIRESLLCRVPADAPAAAGYPADYRPQQSIIESWQRVRARGRRHDQHDPPRVDRAELAQLRSESPMRHTVGDSLELFASTHHDSELMLGVHDADGVLLWNEGSRHVRSHTDALNITEGSRWDEESCATTAVSQVIADPRAHQVLPAEHYADALRGTYCSGAPVFDRHTGDLAGIISLAGPAHAIQPAATVLAHTIATLCERGIIGAHQRSLRALRESASDAFATLPTALLVDDDGLVADSRGVIPPPRVIPPQEGVRQFIPGLGSCVAERAGSGWVIRPAGPAHPLRVALDLQGEPTIAVTGDGEERRVVLTRRHAQIMLLVADAGKAGLSAAQLSYHLYGDSGHVVAVRAEMSRLRRMIGPLISSRPYRLAPSVTLDVTAR